MARSVGCITTLLAISLLPQQPPATIRTRTTLVPVDVRVVDLHGNPVPDLKKEDFTRSRPAPQQPPTFRSGIDVVRLDVSVLDKNRKPVRDLTKGDFTITVDGAPQPVVSFEPIVFPPAPAPTTPWMREIAPDVASNALGEPRLFVIIMDDATTPPDLYMVKSGKAIARAIVDQLSPSDLAAVVFTRDNKGAQDFTSDRARLLRAIDGFSLGTIPQQLRQTYSQGTLRRTIAFLRERPHGRNAIMFISVGAGISNDPALTDLSRDAESEDRKLDQALQQDPDARPGQLPSFAAVGTLTGEARLARVPIYSFNIAGLMGPDIPTAVNPSMATERFTEKDFLHGNVQLEELADATGGRAIINTNAPADAVPAVFEENSSYYLIGYQATYPLTDGRLHRLRIEVHRPDVTVFPADRRLLSAKPVSLKKVVEPPSPLLTALAELVPRSDVPLSVSAAPFALPAGRDRNGMTTAVLTVLRVKRPPVKERTVEQVEVLARAFTPEGKAVASARQNARIVMLPTEHAGEIEVLTQLNLKPGRYNLRFSAHSLALEKSGSVYADVTVPDFTKEKVSLSGMAIAARPSPSPAPRDAFAALVPIVPTTQRDFSSEDRGSAFVRIYQGGRDAVTPVQVLTHLTDAHGRELASNTETIPAGRFTAGRSADYTYELPLAPLLRGSYLLTIEARIAAVSARRDLRFTVR